MYAINELAIITNNYEHTNHLEQKGASPMKKILPVIAALLLFSILSGCAANNASSDSSQMDAVTSATKSRYREGEVTAYNGIRLDPAVGPRDNSIKGIQTVDMENYQLEVTGLVEKPLQMEYDEIRALEPYERNITLHCVEGWDATILWKGVRIMGIIDMAKAKPEADTVIFHAVDGYTTSLPLEVIQERDLILAYGANGLDLPPEMGYPFIVVAEDKLGYKWARWVSEIELSDDPDYEGYWEQRGYSNEANLK